MIRARSGFVPAEPLSGQRVFSAEARALCFPLAAGFGCEVGASIDAARAGIPIAEVELPLRHRATGRDARGFLHRGRQLVDAVLAAGPQATNHRGLRLPLVGAALGARRDPAVAVVAALGLADDLWSGPERGSAPTCARGRRQASSSSWGSRSSGCSRRARSPVRLGRSRRELSQPARHAARPTLKAYLAGAVLARAPVGIAVLLLPYDLREKSMLGDAGSNALGAMLGLSSVSRLTERGRWLAIGTLAGLTSSVNVARSAR